jgi:hypothetical protein
MSEIIRKTVKCVCHKSVVEIPYRASDWVASPQLKGFDHIKILAKGLPKAGEIGPHQLKGVGIKFFLDSFGKVFTPMYVIDEAQNCFFYKNSNMPSCGGTIIIYETGYPFGEVES